MVDQINSCAILQGKRKVKYIFLWTVEEMEYISSREVLMGSDDATDAEMKAGCRSKK